MPNTEILKKFENSLPRYLHASDDYQKYGVKRMERSVAITKAHIRPNTAKRKSFLIFDVDRCDGMLAPQDADLPAPSFSMRNPVNGHAHHAWQLKVPVIFGENARELPQQFFKDICFGFSYQLSADPDYNQVLMKTPFHAWWETEYTCKLYGLSELREYIYVDLSKVRTALVNPTGSDEPVSRTIALFNWLRAWSYAAVKEYKEVKAHREFIDEAYRQAEFFNQYTIRKMFSGKILRRQQYAHVVRSVTNFAWNKYDGRMDGKSFKAIQGKRSAKRWGDSSAAKEVVKELLGKGVSKAEIARQTGFHYNTIKLWC